MHTGATWEDMEVVCLNEGVAADHAVVDYWCSAAGHIVLCSSMSVVPQKARLEWAINRHRKLIMERKNNELGSVTELIRQMRPL